MQKETGERITSQKQVILDYFRNQHHKHPTAQEVHQAVQKKLPHISQATVYRILNSFVEKELVKIIHTEPVRYEYRCPNHAHFVCTNCDRIYDLPRKILIKSILKKQLPMGKVSCVHLYYFGICNKCKK